MPVLALLATKIGKNQTTMSILMSITDQQSQNWSQAINGILGQQN